MYTIQILTQGGGNVVLQYKQKGFGEPIKLAIDAQFKAGEPEMVSVGDDYGRVFEGRLDCIDAYLGTDLTEAFKGDADMKMAIARVNADLAARAAADPRLKLIGAGGFPAQ